MHLDAACALEGERSPPDPAVETIEGRLTSENGQATISL
jgi:hypothetical protein